ncbi:MAG: pyridoxamine 5'-phosphate oxidase [Pleurocapsa sp. SU_196_0]|nr:pyridoxamine 5'-phosphate oxidase [Pleurocapsa sp. SU_196_0]
MSDALHTRKEYTRASLEAHDLMEYPLRQLEEWLEDAVNAGIVEPNAMTLSTVSATGRPSSRVVLLRGVDTGLVFYTNYASRKGQDITATGVACANFWWGDLERQVRVEGTVLPVSADESDAYFHSRPHESQLASAASPQSQPITREDLETRVMELRQQYPECVPRPAHWGGFRLTPDRVEFWQGRAARLHDRIVYTLETARWVKTRLAP